MEHNEQRSYAQTQDANNDSLSNEEKIAALNDEIRCKGLGGRIMITSGIHELGQSALLQIRMMIATFDEFNEDNDAHGERDFGMIVRHQGIWNRLLLRLNKSLAHLLCYIKRPDCDIASAVV